MRSTSSIVLWYPVGLATARIVVWRMNCSVSGKRIRTRADGNLELIRLHFYVTSY